MLLPPAIQRIEGAVIFAAAVYFYFASGFPWLWFLVLLLSFDISMVGYLFNPKAGANLYNLGHSFVLPVVLLVSGYALGNRVMLALGLIWVAHIGLDRVFGYGLKLESGFKDTHLGRISTVRK